MERGWKAAGLLETLWDRVGGRDRLAELTGIQPASLSGYNTGRLRLGLTNARKIAEALDVSVLDLGAPSEDADEAGLLLLDRQAELEAKLLALTKRVTRLSRQVADLEQPAPARKRRGGS